MKKKVFKTIMVYVIALLGMVPSGLLLLACGDIIKDALFYSDFYSNAVGEGLFLLLVVFCSFISSIMMLYYYHKVHARKCDGTEINAI